MGPEKYNSDFKTPNYPGSVNTLGVTQYGGVIISLESILLPGEKSIKITGNAGESLKESANIAYNYCLSQIKKFKLSEELINNNTICLNALKYGIKKSGTSGGVAIATSIISLLLNIEVDAKTCFTGEITLHGDISKVGGIKEKIIGAYNNGYKRVFIPKENKNDLLDVPTKIQDKIEIITVENYSEIFDILFKKHK